jgi:hypothetical protein
MTSEDVERLKQLAEEPVLKQGKDSVLNKKVKALLFMQELSFDQAKRVLKPLVFKDAEATLLFGIACLFDKEKHSYVYFEYALRHDPKTFKRVLTSFYNSIIAPSPFIPSHQKHYIKAFLDEVVL